MPGGKDPVVIDRLDDIDSRFRGLCNDLQVRRLFYVLSPDFRVPGLRNIELIVEAPEQADILLVNMVGENPEYLLLKRVFRNSVVVIQTGLRSPTDEESGIDVGVSPVHNHGQFIPIVNLFKLHLFHRSPGDDQSVKLLSLDVVKSVVKFDQVFFRSIF